MVGFDHAHHPGNLPCRKCLVPHASICCSSLSLVYAVNTLPNISVSRWCNVLHLVYDALMHMLSGVQCLWSESDAVCCVLCLVYGISMYMLSCYAVYPVHNSGNT